MPTFETEIIRLARATTKLQAERRKLAKRIRDINTELRLNKRTMTKLVGELRPEEPMPPLRMFGERQGTTK